MLNLRALLCGAALVAQSSVSLAQTGADKSSAESFDDMLLVANSSFFDRNIDGSVRFPDARRSPIVKGSDCLLRDTSSIPAAWRANFSDRKRRKMLEPYVNVPDYYRQRAVSDVRVAARQLVSAAMPSSLGYEGRTEFECDEYSFNNGGSGGIVFQSKLFLVPAFLAEAALYELEMTTPSRQQEKFSKSRYVVLKRFSLSELQSLDRLAETAQKQAKDLLAEYQREAATDPPRMVGMLNAGRESLNPSVCMVSGDRQRADAAVVYADEFLERNHKAQIDRIVAERRTPPQYVESLRAERRKPAEIRAEKSLNDVFVKMKASASCQLFLGSPKDVMELWAALSRDGKRQISLGDLHGETDLLEVYAKQRGYGSYSEVRFARELGVRREQLQPLLARNIRDPAAYSAVIEEMIAKGYSKERDFDQLLAYLADRDAAAKVGSSAVVERDRRIAAEQLARQEAAARRQKEQQVFDREFPYEAVISCGSQQRHLAILPCFAGGSAGSSTQLELRTPDQYGLYQATDLYKLGREIPGEGLKIPLKRPFSLRAQNGAENFILTVKVVEKASGNVLVIKSVAQFGTISIGF